MRSYNSALTDEYASETMAHSHNRHTDIDFSCRPRTKVAVLLRALCSFSGRDHGILRHNRTPPPSLRPLDQLFFDISAVCRPVYEADFIDACHHSPVGPHPHDIIYADPFFAPTVIDRRPWKGSPRPHLRDTAACPSRTH